MTRITRYVVFELLAAFSVTLAGFTLLFAVGFVVKDGLREGLGLGTVLKMVPFAVLMALQMSIPVAILIACCYFYGRMSADNELVALKSLGISPARIVRPGLVLGFLLSLVAVWINDLAVSWGRRGVYRVVVESVEEVAYRTLRIRRAYTGKRFSISVREVVGDRLIRPNILIRPGDNEEPIIIQAQEARLSSDPDNNKLSILLKNGTIDVGGKVAVAFDDEYEQTIPLIEATRKGDRSDSPSVLELAKIPGQTIEQRRRTEQLEREAAALAAVELMTGDFTQLADRQSWGARLATVAGERARLNRLHLEPWRRWANGFSCFFFVLVGAPLAIRMRTANFFTTFVICFLPILFVYYPLLRFGVERAKEGAVPPYTVWLGNGVLCAVGCLLRRRAVRY